LQRLKDVPFYLLREVVPLLHRPLARHEDVHRDKAALSGGPRAQRMETDTPLLVAREDFRDGFLVLRGKGPAEQPAGCFAQEPDARPHDVRGDDERDQGVQHQPSGELHRNNAEHHALKRSRHP
jgi:hypothetical protein